MQQDHEPPKRGEMLIGFGWMVLFFCVAAPTGFFIFQLGLSRQQDAIKGAGADLYWPASHLWSTLFFFVLIAGVVAIPGVYRALLGSTYMPRVPKTVRRLTVIGAFAALAAVSALGYFTAGHDLAAANPRGVAWLHGGQSVTAHPWSRATGVTVACEMRKRYGSFGHETATLTYEVAFPDGRKAPLHLAYHRNPYTWLTAIAAIDAALRSANVPRTGAATVECLAEKAAGMDQRGLMDLTALYFDRMERGVVR